MSGFSSEEQKILDKLEEISAGMNAPEIESSSESESVATEEETLSKDDLEELERASLETSNLLVTIKDILEETLMVQRTLSDNINQMNQAISGG
tara:strand:- start:180 stop:461 length:282 start_codon:yes stop_codon:yes gene_type:complete